MTMMFSTAQLERFKREAKQLRRSDRHLTHSAALDRIAIQHGFQNWSLLHKHNANTLRHAPSTAPIVAQPPFLFDRTPEEMRQALRTLPEGRNHVVQRISRIDAALALTEDISDRFTSARNSVDFAVAYLSSLLMVPRFYIYPASRVNWEMRCWLPYCVRFIEPFDESGTKGQILLNRHYKPLGQTSKERVEYEIFTNLHLKLDIHQLKELTPYRCSTGYLFHDGTCPWHSRYHATCID